MRTATVLLALTLLPACSTTPRADTLPQSLYLTCAQGKTLIVYDLDPATGALSESQRIALPGRPGPIAISDDRTRLYAALALDGKSSTVAVYDLDPATGRLAAPRSATHRSAPPTGLAPTESGNPRSRPPAYESPAFPAFPTYLDVDNTGRFLLAAYYGPGLATVHAITADGSVAQLIQTVTLEPNAHAIKLDPDNAIAFVPATGPDKVWQFRFDPAAWSPARGVANPPLVPNAPFTVHAGESNRNPDGPTDQPAPRGPRHYVYHPTLPAVYFVNELDSSVTRYTLDRDAGTLTVADSRTTLPDDYTGPNTCADIHITPDGRFLYASNRGHDSIARFAVDPATGELAFLGTTPTEKTPREFCLDAAGRYLYAAGLASAKLAAYRIDPATGDLTPIATYETPDAPIWVEAILHHVQ